MSRMQSSYNRGTGCRNGKVHLEDIGKAHWIRMLGGAGWSPGGYIHKIKEAERDPSKQTYDHEDQSICNDQGNNWRCLKLHHGSIHGQDFGYRGWRYKEVNSIGLPEIAR